MESLRLVYPGSGADASRLSYIIRILRLLSRVVEESSRTITFMLTYTQKRWRGKRTELTVASFVKVNQVVRCIAERLGGDSSKMKIFWSAKELSASDSRSLRQAGIGRHRGGENSTVVESLVVNVKNVEEAPVPGEGEMGGGVLDAQPPEKLTLRFPVRLQSPVLTLLHSPDHMDLLLTLCGSSGSGDVCVEVWKLLSKLPVPLLEQDEVKLNELRGTILTSAFDLRPKLASFIRSQVVLSTHNHDVDLVVPHNPSEASRDHSALFHMIATILDQAKRGKRPLSSEKHIGYSSQILEEIIEISNLCKSRVSGHGDVGAGGPRSEVGGVVSDTALVRMNGVGGKAVLVSPIYHWEKVPGGDLNASTSPYSIFVHTLNILRALIGNDVETHAHLNRRGLLSVLVEDCLGIGIDCDEAAGGFGSTEYNEISRPFCRSEEGR